MMSENNLAFNIQVEIMKRLPVKPLIQFRSISKAWKCHIDCSDFIASYSGQQEHLFVSYDDATDGERKYVSIVDDDTFPHQKVYVTIPPLVKMLKCSYIIGSSRGLLCLFGDYQEGRDGPISGMGRVVLWNPLTTKAVAVVVSNVADKMRYATALGGVIVEHNVLDKLTYATTLGFGICRDTNDPRIVKITYIDNWRDMERITCIPWQVEVFTLSMGAWRRPSSTNLPRKSIRFQYSQVAIDGVLYWLATDWITVNGEFRNLIISFDVTSEEFGEVNLPDSLALQHGYYNLSFSKLRESLVVLEDNKCVWMMEDGVSKSFIKLFTLSVNKPDSSSYLLGFRKTGEPIIKIDERHLGVTRTQTLAIYEPYSKHINDLGINRVTNVYFVYSYMETLHLLDQPLPLGLRRVVPIMEKQD